MHSQSIILGVEIVFCASLPMRGRTKERVQKPLSHVMKCKSCHYCGTRNFPSETEPNVIRLQQNDIAA